MNPSDHTGKEEQLDHMRRQADPLADDTVSRILGPWSQTADSDSLDTSLAANAVPWQRVAAVNRLFGQWQDNRSLIQWRADGTDTPADITAVLENYVHTARSLPDWAEPAKVERAEQLFLDHGVLSCVLLFCSSLPECYVFPDLSSVLNATGQLEKHTDYRIRATAAMVFPVMMPGGLMAPDGSGIAQILKVRLIHATIRNLILRGNPAQVQQAGGASATGGGVVPPLSGLQAGADMQQTLFALGWDLDDRGLPCNQEELAYTLLTFSYVFLRSLRKLGIGLPRADEEAYLHAWNVAGHVLGIRRELMADSMKDAAELFARLQTRGRSRQIDPDPRPDLAQALMNTMGRVLPLRVLKPFPALLTRYLCGRTAARSLGLTRRVSWWSRLLFTLGMLLARGLDTLIRLVSPRFCISRFVTRLLGERFMARILMDQIRPLKLPQPLLARVEGMMQDWRKGSQGRTAAPS